MKGKSKKITMYVLIALYILAFIILKAGLQNSNMIFIILGISTMVLVAIIRIVLYVYSRYKKNMATKEYAQNLIDFKKKADIIKINLNELELAKKKRTDTISIDNSEYSFLNKTSGYKEAIITNLDNNFKFIKVTIPINGKTIDYFVNTEMNTTELKMHFAIKRETLLYVKGQSQYLDLEFINLNTDSEKA